MAVTYTDFMSYPLEIVGIDASETVDEVTTYFYNEKITAIETFVKEDMEYSGNESDIAAILKYFVFYYFCQDAKTTMTADTSESDQVKEFSLPNPAKQVRAWDLGVEKLTAIREANLTTVKTKYTKTCNFFL